MVRPVLGETIGYTNGETTPGVRDCCGSEARSEVAQDDEGIRLSGYTLTVAAFDVAESYKL